MDDGFIKAYQDAATRLYNLWTLVNGADITNPDKDAIARFAVATARADKDVREALRVMTGDR